MLLFEVSRCCIHPHPVPWLFCLSRPMLLNATLALYSSCFSTTSTKNLGARLALHITASSLIPCLIPQTLCTCMYVFTFFLPVDEAKQDEERKSLPMKRVLSLAWFCLKRAAQPGIRMWLQLGTLAVCNHWFRRVDWTPWLTDFYQKQSRMLLKGIEIDPIIKLCFEDKINGF